MSSTKRKTGLGVDAFFQDPTGDKEKAPQTQAPQGKPEKVRTTVILYTDDLAALEEMQIADRRRTGKKPTQSDLLHQAITLLTKQRSTSS